MSKPSTGNAQPGEAAAAAVGRDIDEFLADGFVFMDEADRLSVKCTTLMLFLRDAYAERESRAADTARLNHLLEGKGDIAVAEWSEPNWIGLLAYVKRNGKLLDGREQIDADMAATAHQEAA